MSGNNGAVSAAAFSAPIKPFEVKAARRQFVPIDGGIKGVGGEGLETTLPSMAAHARTSVHLTPPPLSPYAAEGGGGGHARPRPAPGAGDRDGGRDLRISKPRPSLNDISALLKVLR